MADELVFVGRFACGHPQQIGDTSASMEREGMSVDRVPLDVGNRLLKEEIERRMAAGFHNTCGCPGVSPPAWPPPPRGFLLEAAEKLAPFLKQAGISRDACTFFFFDDEEHLIARLPHDQIMIYRSGAGWKRGQGMRLPEEH